MPSPRTTSTDLKPPAPTAPALPPVMITASVLVKSSEVVMGIVGVKVEILGVVSGRTVLVVGSQSTSPGQVQI